MKFGIHVEVDEWCTMVCSITRSKSRSQALQSRKSGYFQKLSPLPLQWDLATDHWILNFGTISKFYWAEFLISGLVFVSHDFQLGRNVVKSWPSVPYGANLFYICPYWRWRAGLNRAIPNTSEQYIRWWMRPDHWLGLVLVFPSVLILIGSLPKWMLEEDQRGDNWHIQLYLEKQLLNRSNM